MGRNTRRNGSAAAGKKGGKGKFAKKPAEKDKIEIEPIDPKKIFRVTFNEITPKAIRAAFEKPAAGGRAAGGCAGRRGVCWTGLWATRFHRCCGQSAARIERGARADRGAAADCRARAGDSRRLFRRNTGPFTRCWTPASCRFSKPRLTKKKGEDIEVKNQEAAGGDCRRSEQGEVAGGERHAEGKAEERAAAIYDFQAAAGRIQPTAVHGEAHDGAGAAAV